MIAHVDNTGVGTDFPLDYHLDAERPAHKRMEDFWPDECDWSLGEKQQGRLDGYRQQAAQEENQQFQGSNEGTHGSGYATASVRVVGMRPANSSSI